MSKTILIDVDGVLANFLGGVEQVLGRKLTAFETAGYDLFNRLPSQDCVRVGMALEGEDFWWRLATIPGSRKGVRLLVRSGARVHIVTKPWLHGTSWMSQRCYWLRNYYPLCGDDITVTSARELIRGDVLIDDCAANIEAWQASNPDGIGLLYDASYNAGKPTFSWSDEDALSRLIASL